MPACSSASRTPLVSLNLEDAPAEIWLKLETLQPIGSFKQGGDGNAMALAPRDRLAAGVYTASTTLQGFYDAMAANHHRKALSLVTATKASWLPNGKSTLTVMKVVRIGVDC